MASDGTSLPPDPSTNPPPPTITPDPQDPKLLFFQTFNQESTSLSTELDSIATSSSSSTPISIRTQRLDACLTRIWRLSDAVHDATSYVPPYDQRAYAAGVKALGERVAAVRKEVAPKGRFAFKAKLGAKGGDRGRTGGVGEVSGGEGARKGGERGEKEVVAREAALRVVDAREQYVLRPAEMEQGVTTSVLGNLQGCVVDLSRSVGLATQLDDSQITPFVSVQMRNIRDSLVVAGRVAGPAHVTDLQNCVVVVACRQFRMHDCKGVDVYLECGSHPIIEDCEGLRFAPLPQIYKSQEGGVESDQWDKIDDFKWLKSEPSPNWRIMPEETRVTEQVWTRMASGGSDAERGELLRAAGIK